MSTLPSIDLTYNISKKTGARILEANLGDGYSQRAADGINAIKDEWNLEWVVNNTDADTLTNFFAARGGYESFDWQPSGESVSKKWTCKSWSKTPVGLNVWSISATLEEAFDLL